MARIKKKPIPRDVYVVHHGTDMMVWVKLKPFLEYYEIPPSQSRKCRKAIKELGIWTYFDGHLIIKKAPQMDYYPPSWSKDYDKSVLDPEYFVRKEKKHKRYLELKKKGVIS